MQIQNDQEKNSRLAFKRFQKFAPKITITQTKPILIGVEFSKESRSVIGFEMQSL